MFHKAIVLSGSILLDGVIASEPKNFPFRLAKKLGYAGDEVDKDILEFLQQADPARMAEEQRSIIEPGDEVMFAFLPHIEPYVTDTTFIAQHPIGMIQKAWSNDIDILTGTTSHEGYEFMNLIKANPKVLSELRLESLVPKSLNLAADDPKRAEFAEQLRKVYYPTSDPQTDEHAYCKVSQMFSMKINLSISILR